jgi:hypothetical protein
MAFQKQHKDTERLVLQLDPAAVPADLSSEKIDFEHTEAVALRI